MPKEKAKETGEIAILSVRNKRTSIHIVWRQGVDEYDVTFHENPRKTFYKAIEALVPHVCTLCELPAKDAEKIIATGITVREKGDNCLALITAKKKIRKGKRVFNISTSILPMYEDDENHAADHMEPEEAKAIEKVIKEATAYINGDREQGQINFDDGSPVEAEKPKPEDKTTPLPFQPEAGSET